MGVNNLLVARFCDGVPFEKIAAEKPENKVLIVNHEEANRNMYDAHVIREEMETPYSRTTPTSQKSDRPKLESGNQPGSQSQKKATT